MCLRLARQIGRTRLAYPADGCGLKADGRYPVHQTEGFGGGTLGPQYDPFMVGGSERGEVSIPALEILKDLNPIRICDRKALLAHLDQTPRMLEQAGL